MALGAADTLEWAGEEVISFEDTQGTRVRLHFDARTLASQRPRQRAIIR